MEDRRIFERFSVRLGLSLLHLNSSAEEKAQTQDISAKGIGLISTAELKPTTPVELWLDIPDKSEPFYTRGRVAWSKSVGTEGFRVGVNLEKAELMGMARVLRSVS